MPFWRKIWMILTLRCEHASQLTSDSFERRLLLYERAALRCHMFVCWSCRQFKRQLEFLQSAFRDSAKREHQELESGPALSNDVKERLKRMRV